MARTASGLNADQTEVIISITDGTYFVYEETPAGTQDGANTSFSLINVPNPASSLNLSVNGQVVTPGGVDYTLTGSAIEFNLAPFAEDVIRADYTVHPNL